MTYTIATPFPEWAWPTAWHWAKRAAFDDSAPRSLDEYVELHLKGNAETFGIYRDGDLGGVVVVERASSAVRTAHIVLARRFWGMPVEPLRAIAEGLFHADPRLQRIQAVVPAWNRTACGLCRRMGAVREGVLRNYCIRNGKPADAVVFSVIREDIENGREFGRGTFERAEPVIQHGDNQPVGHERDNVHRGPTGDSERAGGVLSAVVPVDDKRNNESKHAGGNDGGGGRHQPKLPDGGRRGSKEPGPARVRKERRVRESHASDGIGTASGTGRKRIGRRKVSAGPE